MQIPIQHTTKSVREMQKLQTPMWRRGLRGLRNVRALIYLVIGGWVAIGMIVRGVRAVPQNSHDIGSGIGLLLFVLAVPLLLMWRAQSAVNKGLAAQVPGTLDLGSAGVTTTQTTGVTAFQPWSEFTSFREGQHTIVLARRGKDPAQIIPVEGMDASMRGTMRSILLSNLPEKM